MNFHSKTKNDLPFYILTILLITIPYFIFNLRIKHTLFKKTREQYLKRFVEKIQKDRKIDSRDYWKFRDFYCFGLLKINKQVGFQNPVIYKIKNIDKTKTLTVAQFKCKNAIGYETLAPEQYIIQLIRRYHRNFFLDKSKEATTIFTFFSNKELRNTVGFLDKEKDKKLLKNKGWISITKFK